MATIRVRGLTDRAVELLKLRAARSDMDAKWKKFFAAVDQLDISAKPGEPLAEDLIRQDRDRGYREL